MSAGLVLPDCTVISAARVRVDLDVRRHRFLADHLVAGRPLLPTVMGAEVMACAVAAVRPGTAIAGIAHLTVGPPFFLPAAGTGSVEVSVGGGEPARCTVTSVDAVSGVRTEHFRAEVHTGAPPAMVAVAAVPVAAVPPAGVRVAADPVYELFFHGPSFRVVGWASLAADRMLGRLASGLSPVTDPARASLLAPLLVELCLQTAGLWEIATSGAMDIPLGIDRVRRLTPADSSSTGTLTAVVTPRSAGVFDAVVADAGGVPQLVLDGYRTTPFEHDYDRAAADRLRRRFTPG